ncbi:MAG TPA: dTMP kinase [Casimicrobiaceae bacterium]|nr:dTMP kinase [Casimicrobiaceae bacterium]
MPTSTPAPARGRFVTLEGIDGAGKSTHVPAIAGFLRGYGLRVVTTREPGGTPVGEALRAVVLNERMEHDTETLLMFAARREHIVRTIAPALARGDWVLCDRYTDATWAYQGGGHGVSASLIVALEREVVGDVVPDVTLLFDLPEAVSRERRSRARVEDGAVDKFEREPDAFFERVRAAYRARAAADPGRFRVIDASRPVSDIRIELKRIVEAICRSA